MSDIKLLSIDSAELSVRSKNALHREGIHTIGEMLECTEERLTGIRNLGAKSITEILNCIEYHRKKDAVMKSFSSISSGVSEKMDEIDEKNAVLYYLSFHDVQTEALELLSARAYNILSLAGYDRLEKFIYMTADELMDIEGMDALSSKEIAKECLRYLRDNREEILSFLQEGETNIDEASSLDDVCDVRHRRTILEYVRVNEIHVENMMISNRAKNRLLHNEYRMMSDIIFMTKEDIARLGGLGEGSIKEVLDTIDRYRLDHKERIVRYIDGDMSVLVDDHMLISMIQREFQLLNFNGLSLHELHERLEKNAPITEDRIKKALGKLIADGELEYVDYSCYKVFTKFRDFYQNTSVDELDKKILSARIAGRTLEDIGDEVSLTKERIRQRLKRCIGNIRTEYVTSKGTDLFDEDYYRYLYETYNFDFHESSPWLGIAPEIWNYLDIAGVKPGELSLELALRDTQNLESGLRLKIKNYINRNRIYIDGKWIEKKRSDLESVVVRKFCADNEVTFIEFADIFNTFLKDIEIPYNEDIYYTEAVLATRRNRFMESRSILWKYGDRFRYYDIDGQDYTELFETLNLNSYHNVELSTAKFVMEYPDLMDKYDIRDGYELHNLLKKVLETDCYGKYEKIKFSKMPNIRFGTPDRDSDLFDIMVENAPISRDDLFELIHKEFGYEIKQIFSYAQHLAPYYHQGMYIIDQKEMSKERMAHFRLALTEDFYTFDELKCIYRKLFIDADIEEINSYNLKRMGFVVNSKYVVQNYDSAAKYIETKLTEEDMFDITPFRNRFATYQTYQGVLLDLRKNLQIIEYEPDQYINFRKLERGGLTKDMIREFCDAVYEAAEDGKFFTIYSLRQKGFENELFDFGFGDLFYGSLLLSDERFSFKKLWGTMILRKDKEEISAKNFLVEIIMRERKIDLYDLETLLCEEYGCITVDTYDCVQRSKDAEIFYDSELQIFYADQELYYNEIDEMGDF